MPVTTNSNFPSRTFEPYFGVVSALGAGVALGFAVTDAAGEDDGVLDALATFALEAPATRTTVEVKPKL